MIENLIDSEDIKYCLEVGRESFSTWINSGKKAFFS